MTEGRQHDAAGQYTESLDAVLKHDSRRISKLISCVGYTSNSAVQLEAIRLTRVLAARQPHLVDMLVQQRPKITPDGKHGEHCICLSLSVHIVCSAIRCLASYLAVVSAQQWPKTMPQVKHSQHFTIVHMNNRITFCDRVAYEVQLAVLQHCP